MSTNYRNNPFDVCFAVNKLKYADFNNLITESKFLYSTDKVNVFINLESVLSHLSMIKELEGKLLSYRQSKEILASNILNLAAHYRKFFVSSGLDTRVYLYMTDLDSDEFVQRTINPNFRDYYLCKYNVNPKFGALSDELKNQVLPLVQQIVNYIPGVYLIRSKNVEGSVVPYLISKQDMAEGYIRKNFVVTADLFETQYTGLENFFCLYIRRDFANSFVTYDHRKIIQHLMRNKKEVDPRFLQTYEHLGAYTAFLTCYGNKLRSIDPINGIGIIRLEKYLRDGYERQVLLPNSTTPESLSTVFPESYREGFVNGYRCTAIPYLYLDVSAPQKESILLQRMDRINNQGLVQLNGKQFAQHPILLEALLSSY